MAKAYLIGDPPRVGKTSLTLKFIERKPILATSTDAIRYTLRRVVDEHSKPDLFNVGKFTSNDPEQRKYLTEHVQEVIDQQNTESSIVWKSTVDFINSNLEDGFDILIEGIAVLPSFVKDLQCEYSVVFIGNQSDEHFNTILNQARNNPNDWLHNLEDETIKAFCLFGQCFSKYLEDEAKSLSMSYIEVMDNKFDECLTSALNELICSNNR